MNRQMIGNGKWFDTNRAESWDEDTRHDGRNFISIATGSQWEHERLYRSAHGQWILHAWSAYQGSSESYETIAAPDAARWLVANDHGDAAEEHFPAELTGQEV